MSDRTEEWPTQAAAAATAATSISSRADTQYEPETHVTDETVAGSPATCGAVTEHLPNNFRQNGARETESRRYNTEPLEI